jgi:hypothetical protein
MSPDPTSTASSGAAERRPAVWPWLLLPLVMLALFFALRSIKQPPVGHAAGNADTAVEAAPGEASGSR